MATAADNESSLEKISDEDSRWMVVGICLTKVLTPALRVLLHNKMQEWYETLIQPPHEINKQTLAKHIRKYPPDSEFNFNYKNINNNSSRQASLYDYAVKDSISLAMLFVQPFMAKFNGFDETMDTSAVLSVVAEAQPFNQARDAAKKIRSDVRNKWAHCNLSYWNDVNFQAALTDMKNLIDKIDLTETEKTKIYCDLDDWKQKGTDLCFGQQKNSELLSLFQKEIVDLHETVKSCKKIEDSQIEVAHSLETSKKDLEQELEALKNSFKQLKLQQEKISRKNDEEPSSADNEDESLSIVDGPVHDDSQINNTPRAPDPPQDTTRLSQREVAILSLKIVTVWKDIAGLANVDKDEVENVSRDYMNYLEPKNKAAGILDLISKRPNFSRKKLGNIFKEAGKHSLVDDLLKGTFYHEA